MVSVYLALGSNQGDRSLYISSAIDALSKAFGTPPTAVSDLIETTAQGFSGPDFLNAAVRYDIPRRRVSAQEQALDILDVCKSIERSLGRTGDPQYDSDGSRIYSDRPIDIDILFFGTHVIQTPRLSVPHPRISERDFVKIPLFQIASPRIRAFSGLS